VRGGTGWKRFRRKKAESWTGSGRGASGGGEEAVGSWDLGGVKRLLRIPARKCRGGSVSRGGRRGKAAGEKGCGSGFIGEHSIVEERERERRSRAELRTAGGAGVPSRAWQPLGSGGPTWLRGERPAGAARAVGEVVGRRVGEGRAVQVCSGSGSSWRRWVTRARQRQGRSRARGRLWRT
jgi:hypothetical protein